MSYKIYYDDSFIKDFTATVISCEKQDDRWAVVLDKTAFYPEGGGQPCDKGYMEADDEIIDVREVKEKGEKIIHYCNAPVSCGQVISGHIDWRRRFDFMQQHTGEHMFSGVVHSMFGYNNVGFHMNEKDVVVDFDGVLSRQDIQAVMDKCNEIVWANQPVIAYFPDNVQEMEYRSKKALQGDIRIVKAGDADVCACCGTHTATTAQAGPIVALTFSSYKGGTRISMLCGKRAIDYLKKQNDNCYEISHLLSSPVNNITSAVSSRLKEIDRLKLQLSQCKKQLIEMWAQEMTAQEGICAVEKAELDSSEIQSFTLMLANRADIAAVISPQSAGGCKICVISQSVNTNGLGKHISSYLGGKGGGKPGIYQGVTEKSCSQEQLFSIIKNYQP